MNITAAAALAALILAGTPAFASAAPAQANPIHLNNVSIAEPYDYYQNLEPGAVSIAFTNQSAVSATDIVFNLVDGSGKILAQYNDLGSYAQGATFRHNFKDAHLDMDQRIEVGQVTFADGSSWSAPAQKVADAPIFPAE